MKRLILASSSTIYGSGYLDYLLPTLRNFFKEVKTLLFIPYARPSGISYDDYTSLVAKPLALLNIKVKGIHQYSNPQAALQEAEAIFTGGGNTFELVHQLYKNKLFPSLKEAISSGVPYLGTSAGSNICGISMMTTNDMPIVFPQSFETLGVIPFNLNVHYLDADVNSTHKGETRETRIKEFLMLNSTPVIGLREGSWLEVFDNKIYLKGGLKATLFSQENHPQEIENEQEVLI